MNERIPNSLRRPNPLQYPEKKQVPPTLTGIKFGLSRHWIQNYADAELAASRQQLRDPAALLAALREADDPDRPWPAQSLIAALDLPVRPHRVLMARLQDTVTEDLSLKELMDVVLLGEGEIVNFHRSALMSMDGLGVKAFIDVARALTGLDMGPRCNAMWYKRIAKLRDPWACVREGHGETDSGLA